MLPWIVALFKIGDFASGLFFWIQQLLFWAFISALSTYLLIQCISFFTQGEENKILEFLFSLLLGALVFFIGGFITFMKMDQQIEREIDNSDLLDQ